jgi:tetratricopeptide (TPR) repeat protein
MASAQPPDPTVWPALTRLIQATSVEAAAEVVLQNPALLTEQADQFASVLVETAYEQPDLDLRWKANWVKDFLFVCRRHGAKDAVRYSMKIPANRITRLSALWDQLNAAYLSKSQTDLQRGLELCDKALALVYRESESSLWAQLKAKRGSLLIRIEGPGREERFEQAISMFLEAAAEVDPKTSAHEWAQYQDTLAVFYLQRPTGARGENAELAIASCTRALQVFTREDDEENWADVMNSLAAAYAQRTGGIEQDNLELARTYCLQALEVRTFEASPNKWAESMSTLGGILYRRHTPDRTRDIEQAIQAYDFALSVITQERDARRWASMQSSLCAMYCDRIAGDRAQNLETAIEAGNAAQQVFPRARDSRTWGDTSLNLARAYLVRSQGNRTENLQEAIRQANGAREVFPQDQFPREFKDATHYLAKALRDLPSGDRIANQEEAIRLLESLKALISRQDEPESWGDLMDDLGVAYADRISGDMAQNVETAIEHFSRALEVRTRDKAPILWAGATDNLASAYRVRIVGDRTENIERAVTLFQDALEVNTRGANVEDWATATMNLATTYTNRVRGDRNENLATAIRLYGEVLSYRTPDKYRREWATAMINLATAHSDSERAIGIYKQLLEVLDAAKDPEFWPTVQTNLGNAYAATEFGNRAENLELAIAAYEQALDARPDEAHQLTASAATMNFARALAERERGVHADNVQRAKTLYRQVLDVARLETMPERYLQVQSLLGDLCFDGETWDEAATAYRGALKAIEFLFRAAATPEARQSHLQESRRVPARLAFALAKCGELEEALTVAESGRTRILAEALALDEAPVRELLPAERKGFEDAREKIRTLQGLARNLEGQPDVGRFVRVSEQLSGAYAELRAALAAIQRRLPGFLAPAGIQEVKAAAMATPLVYLMATPAGGLGLMVSPDGTVSAIWLPDLKEAELFSKTQEYLDAYLEWRESPQSKVAISTWVTTLDGTLRWLWDAVMAGTVAQLGAARSATLIPTGLLGLFPLHAAWTANPAPGGNDRLYALDLVTFRYAPSARMLRREAHAANESILLVSEPAAPSEAPLENAPNEIAAVSACFENQRSLRGAEASSKMVLQQAPAYNVLHFCCHGRADLLEPLNSGLMMAFGQTVSLRNLLEIRLPATRLAVLSACETGVPGTRLPDEVVGLPAGFLRAGVGGVAASLWAVADESTMELMSKFYALWRQQKLEPAEALCCAQQAVRDSGTGRFQHPFFWAAFTYTGR